MLRLGCVGIEISSRWAPLFRRITITRELVSELCATAAQASRDQSCNRRKVQLGEASGWWLKREKRRQEGGSRYIQDSLDSRPIGLLSLPAAGLLQNDPHSVYSHR